METSTQTDKRKINYETSTKSIAKFARRLALLAIVAVAVSACGVRRFRDPETGHVIYESHRFGNHEKFESITATYITRSGATNTICIKGYVSDQVSGIKAAFEGAGTLSGKAAAAMVKP